MNIIEKVIKIIENDAKKKTNFFGIGGFEHILDVNKYAKLLANKRNADEEVVQLAALFHDYSSLLDKKYIKEHKVHSGIKAEEILLKFHYPKEKIEIIKDAIYCHRGSKKRRKKTIEAKCLADADAMAHFVEIPDLFYLAYATYKIKNRKEAKKFVREKLGRSWGKISPDAKQLIKKEYQAAKIILKD